MTAEPKNDERAVRLAAESGQANLRLARVRAVVADGLHELTCHRLTTISQPCNCWLSKVTAALDGPLS